MIRLEALHNALPTGSSGEQAATLLELVPGSRAGERWDRFVAGQPGGDLVQTTAWAEAKRALGFEVCHLVRLDQRGIAAGAQLVVTRLGPLGGVGYVARGPLVAGQAIDEAMRTLDGIEGAARANRVRHLVIQPPSGGEWLTELLAARGYLPGAPEMAPSATLVIDLAPNLETILARMSTSARRSARVSQRRGVENRLGDRGDLELFHGLHQASARRRGFRPLSLGYLRHHWDVLHPRGAVQVVFACHEGRAIAANWLTAFGDTVTARLWGRSGESNGLKASAACEWGSIRWAKEAGYRRYDTGGFPREIAALLLAGQPLPADIHRSHAGFKAQFGGRPVLLPEARQRTLNPFLGFVLRPVLAGMARNAQLCRLITRLRNG